MQEKLENVIKELELDLKQIKNQNDLVNLKSKVLGKNSVITEAYNKFKTISNEEKKAYGEMLNKYKQKITISLDNAKAELENIELMAKLEGESIDITLPGVNLPVGSIHPVEQVIRDVEDYFISMGYDIAVGPELETADNNFTLLNIPESHPTRDDQDSFYINPEYLLRTQTSPVQIRTMLENKEKTDIRILCPGKVYRRDTDDATHTHQFAQFEGLVVGTDITIANCKAVLEQFAKHVFGNDKVTRLRPNYFPFTEPSFEMDVSCSCPKNPCSICKGTKWIEILGAGMVHPNVLDNCGYDSKTYTGFAFGIGVERVAMLKYDLKDIRELFNNDIRFLKQFKEDK